VGQERDRYLTIFEIIPNPSFILNVENRIDNINNVAFELFRDLLPPGVAYYGRVRLDDVLPWIREDLDAFVTSDALETSFEKDVETRRGLIHFQIKLKRMLDLYEKFLGTIVILNDISYLKQAERTVARARDFYLTLFEELPTLIWRAGPEGRFNYFNRAWLQFTGRTSDEEVGNGWMQGVHSDDLKRVGEVITRARESRKPFEMEFRMRRHDGRFHWMLNVGRPFNDLDGAFAGFLGSCYDITERKTHEQDLFYQATHDLLTGLPNRRVIETDLPRVISRTERDVDSVVLVLDLDRFKNINDAYGHGAGDKVLVEVGIMLRKLMRGSDLLTRMGGDEFAVLLEDIDMVGAEKFAQRLCEAVAGQAFIPEMGDSRLSLSIGLALIKEHEIPGEVLTRADQAMYRAKELGGGRTVIAD
jgi:diguanylate cyclase (GGDEF)-like protein/PAS domain S-box-containing protein